MCHISILQAPPATWPVLADLTWARVNQAPALPSSAACKFMNGVWKQTLECGVHCIPFS